MLTDALNSLRTHTQPDQMRDVLLDIAYAFMDRDEDEVGEDERKLFTDFISTALNRLGDEIKTMLSEAVCDSSLVSPALVADLAHTQPDQVVRPFLMHSPTLDDQALVELTKSGTEVHQIAIASRDSVSEPVTDALITHGTDNVLVALSDNQKAKYSRIGLAQLLHRVGDNPLVQASLVRRAQAEPGFDAAILNSVDASLRNKLGDLVTLLDSGAYQQIVRTTAEGIAHAAGRELSDRVWRMSLMQRVRAGTMTFDAAFSELCESGRLRDCLVSLAERLGLSEALVASNFARSESDRLAIICRAAEISDETYARFSKLRLTATDRPEDDLPEIMKEYYLLNPAQARRAVRIVRIHASNTKFVAAESVDSDAQLTA